MTLIELLVLYFGRPREVAGSPNALNQCVDWANSYIKDVLNLSIIEWTDAKDFASKAGDKYDFIKSTPTNFPSFGDIVIWNKNIGGGHGHIAVALGGDANTFVSTDENWSISQRVTVERHNYDNVDGWLHPKQILSDTIPVLKSDFERLVSNSTKYDAMVQAGYIAPDQIKALLATSELAKNNAETHVATLENALKGANMEIGVLQEQIALTPTPTNPIPKHTELKILGLTLWILSQ